MACSARWGLVTSIGIEVGVKRRVPLLPCGRVAGRPEMTLVAQSLACGTEMRVRRVVNKSGLTMHWKLRCIGGKHELLSTFLYSRCLCVSRPLRFYPWVGLSSCGWLRWRMFQIAIYRLGGAVTAITPL